MHLWPGVTDYFGNKESFIIPFLNMFFFFFFFSVLMCTKDTKRPGRFCVSLKNKNSEVFIRYSESEPTHKKKENKCPALHADPQSLILDQNGALVMASVCHELQIVYIFQFCISCTTVHICCSSLSVWPAAKISAAMTCGACNSFGTCVFLKKAQFQILGLAPTVCLCWQCFPDLAHCLMTNSGCSNIMFVSV